MSIEKATFYLLRCDECGECTETGEGGTAVYGSRKEARKAIKNNDWRRRKGRDLCGICAHEPSKPTNEKEGD